MAAPPDSEYLPRFLDAALDGSLSSLPAIMIVGPRASGKTTTAGRRAASIVRFDQPRQAAAFADDPDAALGAQLEPVLLDEWQLVPEVLGAVKRSVDAAFTPRRFFVTGSVRATLENRMWPGTGRLVRVPMYPMTVREQRGAAAGSTFFDRLVAGGDLPHPADPPDLLGYVELALRGGFPGAALNLPPDGRADWLAGYVDELLQRDIPDLVGSATRPPDERRLRSYFGAYAINSAGTADHKTIYDAAHVSKVTGIAYERLLSDLFVVEQIPAWSSNRLKRLVRQPKRYLIDASLIGAVLGIDARGVIRDGNVLGRLIDTFVTSQLRPELAVSTCRPRLHHLRTSQGRQEIDLVVELAAQRLIGIEIKATGAPRRSDARHLMWLRDQLGDDFVAGVVFHTGPRVFGLDERITAVPIATLWS
jgi:predicted AAA+ superfamily ATPase